MAKNAYGTTPMFGREIPLTKSGGLNQVFLKSYEKKIYNEYLETLQSENREQSMLEIAAFFNSKK